MRKLKPWEVNKLTYKEWGEMKHDWINETKLDYVESYFFRLNNYIKGQQNHFILKSTFGMMSDGEIKQSIEKWFNHCIGVYSEIELNK